MSKKKKFKFKDELLLICSCYSKEHQIIIQRDKDDTDIVYASIHLSPLPFFKRLKLGIKYIFGYRSMYGEFDEFMFNKTHIEKLKTLVKYLEDIK